MARLARGAEALTTIVNGLQAALFPTHYGRPNLTDESIDFFVGDTLNTTLNRLAEQVRRSLERYFEDLNGQSAAGLYELVVAQVERLLLQAAQQQRV